jgi:hypothetical protein
LLPRAAAWVLPSGAAAAPVAGWGGHGYQGRMWVIALLGCRDPVIGMRIVADVTCAPTDPDGDCGVSNLSAPCRCHAHDFDRDAGLVDVYGPSVRDADPVVVFSLDYTSDEALCGADHLVFDAPVGIRAVDGTPIYTVDSTSALLSDDAAPLLDDAVDTLTFRYPTASGVVTEVHTVAFRDAMEVRTFEGIPCCGVPVRPGGVAILAAFAAVMAGLGRRGVRVR